MSQNTLRKQLRRCPERWSVLKLKPIEHDRAQVDDREILEYKARLKKALDGQPAQFVFNCDESGFDSWADCRRTVSCLVPPDVRACDVHYPVKRNEKRITLLGCISAAGDSLMPLCITSQKTIDIDVLKAGYTPDRVAFSYSDTGYVTEQLFRKWLVKIFVPHIQSLRARRGCPDQKAFLIMDNCTCHESDAIYEICHKYGIEVLPLVPHSSHLTQQLDIGIFGNVKLAQSRIHPSSDMSTQSQQLLRMLGAWVQVTHPMGVTSAFRRSGITVSWSEGRLLAYVDAEEQQSSRIDVGDGLWPEADVVIAYDPESAEVSSDSDWEPVRHEANHAELDRLLAAAEEIDSDGDASYTEETAGPRTRKKRTASFTAAVAENDVQIVRQAPAWEPPGWSGRPVSIQAWSGGAFPSWVPRGGTV